MEEGSRTEGQHSKVITRCVSTRLPQLNTSSATYWSCDLGKSLYLLCLSLCSLRDVNTYLGDEKQLEEESQAKQG